MAMQTPVPLNRKVKYFAAAVDDSLPYIKASRSYLADQLEGKKYGDTYFFYFPDPGTAEVGTKNLDISGMNGDVFERVIACTVESGKTKVDLTAWNKMQEIEDFAQEIAIPRGRRLAAEIEKDVIAKNVWVSDNVTVVPKNVDGTTGLDTGTFLLLSTKMRGVKAAGKIVGFAHPNLYGLLSDKLLLKFLPSEIMSKVYNDYFIGNFASTGWISENFMPVVEVGATAPAITAATFNAPVGTGISATDGTITVTGTNLFVGAAFEATYTDPVDGTTKDYGTVDLNGMAVPHEKKTFVVASVNAAGTSGVLAGSFRFSSNGLDANSDLVVNTNPSVQGDQAALATATFTSVLGASKSYYVVQVRDHDWLEWDTAKFPNLAGCENGSSSVGGITVQTAEWGDINTRNSIMRVDVPYVAKGIDPRLSRLAYVEI